MDISSKAGYPASALSNFAPHPFVIDGVECNSMEGFLQSLKFKEIEMQKIQAFKKHYWCQVMRF